MFARSTKPPIELSCTCLYQCHRIGVFARVVKEGELANNIIISCPLASCNLSTADKLFACLFTPHTCTCPRFFTPRIKYLVLLICTFQLIMASPRTLPKRAWYGNHIELHFIFIIHTTTKIQYFGRIYFEQPNPYFVLCSQATAVVQSKFSCCMICRAVCEVVFVNKLTSSPVVSQVSRRGHLAATTVFYTLVQVVFCGGILGILLVNCHD